jgi:hypothetical protein
VKFLETSFLFGLPGALSTGRLLRLGKWPGAVALAPHEPGLAPRLGYRDFSPLFCVLQPGGWGQSADCPQPSGWYTDQRLVYSPLIVLSPLADSSGLTVIPRWVHFEWSQPAGWLPLGILQVITTDNGLPILLVVTIPHPSSQSHHTSRHEINEKEFACAKSVIQPRSGKGSPMLQRANYAAALAATLPACNSLSIAAKLLYIASTSRNRAPSSRTRTSRHCTSIDPSSSPSASPSAVAEWVSGRNDDFGTTNEMSAFESLTRRSAPPAPSASASAAGRTEKSVGMCTSRAFGQSIVGNAGRAAEKKLCSASASCSGPCRRSGTDRRAHHTSVNTQA